MYITHAVPADLHEIAALEAACFPAEEACSEQTFARRLLSFPECFWLLREDDGTLVSCVNGFATNERDLSDEMYAFPDRHDPSGAWQMLFGVLTRPDRQHHGYASLLLREVERESRQRGRLGIVLTCKRALLPFYLALGYTREGISDSKHGGAEWLQLRLSLRDPARQP